MNREIAERGYVGMIEIRNDNGEISFEYELQKYFGFEPENIIRMSPTQRAIYSYRYYVGVKRSGRKISQEQAANLFGVSRPMISRAKKLVEVAPVYVVEKLTDGDKIKLPDGTYTSSILVTLGWHKNKGIKP